MRFRIGRKSFYRFGIRSCLATNHKQTLNDARIASRVRFRIGRKSFYRFGIRSCLATNHKQTLNDAIQHDVILQFGFPGNTTG